MKFSVRIEWVTVDTQLKYSQHEQLERKCKIANIQASVSDNCID